ncbi:MAG: GGDEF domain-containing protein [Xanthobacteraceae bacterium]
MAYSRIGELPLVIGIGQSTAAIYAQSIRYTTVVVGLIVLLCVTTLVLALYLARELKRRASAEMELAALANSDALTDLSNRRHFNDILQREWCRSALEKNRIALLMIDVDFFKPYNDANGHQAGDALLQTIGRAMTESLDRSIGFGARFGGDEFALLLPAATIFEAERIAARFRERYSASCEQGGITSTGLSIGVAAVLPEAMDSEQELIRAADVALYSAKQRGRNRTEAAADTGQGHSRWAA